MLTFAHTFHVSSARAQGVPIAQIELKVVTELVGPTGSLPAVVLLPIGRLIAMSDELLDGFQDIRRQLRELVALGTSREELQRLPLLAST